mmetsp:Transcript_7576/g.28456  ORF Transcript_7576/g.28456 Transcript_7576/m.28456 type:complete len:83 (+) Transcript_7576:799-1047(+)
MLSVVNQEYCHVDGEDDWGTEGSAKIVCGLDIHADCVDSCKSPIFPKPSNNKVLLPFGHTFECTPSLQLAIHILCKFPIFNL